MIIKIDNDHFVDSDKIINYDQDLKDQLLYVFSFSFSNWPYRVSIQVDASENVSNILEIIADKGALDSYEIKPSDGDFEEYQERLLYLNDKVYYIADFSFIKYPLNFKLTKED